MEGGLFYSRMQVCEQRLGGGREPVARTHPAPAINGLPHKPLAIQTDTYPLFRSLLTQGKQGSLRHR